MSETTRIGGIPVFIDTPETHLSDLLEEYARKGSLHLVCDTNTYRHCFPQIRFHQFTQNVPVVIDAGESFKTLATCEKVWSTLVEQGADRESTVINLGGGMVTDLGGFCAATFMRGVRFIHIPTTLLGMCDAAIGGKLGIDYNGLKNYIGVIRQPEFVWIDTRFLSTLSEKQLRNGMAEVIKHALIGDRDLFHLLNEKPDLSMINSRMIEQAIVVKKSFVDGDIYEKGKRTALNFGHTFGHAIESCFLNTPSELLHGESVALGMIAETWLSFVLQKTMSYEECQHITTLIMSWTTVTLNQPVKLSDLMPYMVRDKKNQQSRIRCTLLQKIGEVGPASEIPEEALLTLVENPEIADNLPWLCP